jgi:pSer/pThr/pTyr-binding forkhead associated (FHA) protein
VLKRKEIESQKSISRKNMYFPAVANTDDKYSTESCNPLFSPAFLTQNLTASSKSDKPMKAVIWVADFLIGSDKCLCDFCIDHASVSDRHARILFRKPLYFLVDLGSADGTWLGSRRLYSYEENPLTDGDIIVCGEIHFIFNHTAQV